MIMSIGFLKRVGLEFWDDQESLNLFKEAGATVKGSHVSLIKALIQNLCKTAPSEFEMLARNPKRSTIFGGNKLVSRTGVWLSFCI